MCKAMQELLADERVAGVALGISQGISRAMGLISFILNELSKFAVVPENLISRISGEQDMDILNQWGRTVILADSIQEFEAKM